MVRSVTLISHTEPLHKYLENFLLCGLLLRLVAGVGLGDG